MKTKEAIVYEVQPHEFIKILAEQLKKIPEFEMPEWARFIKTSVARARPPYEQDWWLKRSASILRQLYIQGVVGVNRLRTRYGGLQDRGMRPSKFKKGSGKIIRVILQKAEKSGFIEKVKGNRSGRKLTKKGKEFLDEIAKSMKK